jgi:hypothetical protein
MAQPAAQDAFDPWASAAVAQQQQPAVDLLGGSSEPIVQAVSQFDPFGAQPEPTPAQSGELYKAVTDYAATDQRMLALKKGDTLTKEREEDGWFFGHNERGQSGYFPYAQRLPASRSPPRVARSSYSLPRSPPPSLPPSRAARATLCRPNYCKKM